MGEGGEGAPQQTQVKFMGVTSGFNEEDAYFHRQDQKATPPSLHPRLTRTCDTGMGACDIINEGGVGCAMAAAAADSSAGSTSGDEGASCTEVSVGALSISRQVKSMRI